MDLQSWFTDQARQVVLIHHWDTDGLASAAIVRDVIAHIAPATDIQLFCPTINNYFLTPAEYTTIKDLQPDGIIVVDYNLPLDNIEKLEQITTTFVFDHHVQTNEINRPGLQSIDYPGCSMLVSDYFLQPLTMAAVLGMVGDQEEAIKQWPAFFPAVEQILTEQNLSFEELLRITKLLDTSYIINQPEAIKHSVDLIAQYALQVAQPQQFLHDAVLLKQEQQIAAVLAQETNQDQLRSIQPGVWYHELSTELSLISEVTRALARANPESIIITVQRRGVDASLYVRSRRPRINLTPIVDAARAAGFNAGGKPEVAGVVLPSDQVDEFVKTVVGMVGYGEDY